METPYQIFNVFCSHLLFKCINAQSYLCYVKWMLVKTTLQAKVWLYDLVKTRNDDYDNGAYHAIQDIIVLYSQPIRIKGFTDFETLDSQMRETLNTILYVWTITHLGRWQATLFVELCMPWYVLWFFNKYRTCVFTTWFSSLLTWV